MQQNAPQRAWQDTRRWLLNSFIAYTLMLFVTLGCGVLSALFIPTNAIPLSQAIYGAIGAIVGFVLCIVVTYLVHLLITPYRQRNEARDKVNELVQKISALEEDFKKKLHGKENVKRNIIAELLQTGDNLFNQRIDTKDKFINWELELNSWYSLAVQQITENFSDADAVLFRSVSATMFPLSFTKAFRNSNNKHNNYLNQLRAYLQNLRELLKRI